MSTMPELGEPERIEGQQGSAAAGPLPEGATADAQAAAHPASRQGVPPFRARAEAPDSLDLLLDEPELLMRALRQIANNRRGRSWDIVAFHAAAAEEALKEANEPPKRD